MLSTHFSIDEFFVKSKGPWTENHVSAAGRLCRSIEPLRLRLGPMVITSGYRSERYNREVGGAADSYHKKGRAMDFKVKGKTPRQCFNIALDMMERGVIPRGGLHAYRTFVHIDDRGYVQFWN